MNTFQAHRIQESGGIANDQTSIKVTLRLRPIATLGNCLGAIGIKRAAFQDARYIRMRFKLLKSAMRIEKRIEIIEADDESNRDPAIGHVVNKSAPEFFIAKRPAHRMNHTAAGLFLLRNVPDFFHSNRVDLRISVSIEIESLDELLCQRAAGSLGKNGDLRPNVDTGFKVALFVTFLVGAFVARPNAGDRAVIDEEFCTGKARENSNAAALDLLPQPTSEFVQRND